MNLKIKFELEETELKGEIENLIPSSSGGSLPSGGTTGQVLTKNSNADGDAGWKDSSGAAFSDDGSGNISVNGASANAKRFLNSLTVPGLDYKYVNPINSGTYTSPYGVYISSGTVIDYVVGLTQVGFYTAYVNRKVTDIPDAAKAANSSLRGFVCVSQIDNTASGGSQKCYAYIVLIDQNSNFYIQYIQSSTGGGWKRMYPYETAESALMEKLDKNQGTSNSGKFLGIGADGIVVPTDVGGGSEWVQVLKLKTEEDLHYITVSADTNGNELSFDEAYVFFVASKSSTDSSGIFGIGLRNWTTSFNGKTALYNYQMYNDAYIYAWYVQNISDDLGVKVEEILMNRFGNNLDSVSYYSDSSASNTYRAKDTAAEHSTIIRGSNVTKNTNGKLTTITLGVDMSSSIGFKAGCYLEVFVK